MRNRWNKVKLTAKLSDLSVSEYTYKNKGYSRNRNEVHFCTITSNIHFISNAVSSGSNYSPRQQAKDLSHTPADIYLPQNCTYF